VRLAFVLYALLLLFFHYRRESLPAAVLIF
jgi:hypothetical protein